MGVGVDDGVSEIVGVSDAEGVIETDGVTEGVGVEDLEGIGIRAGCDKSQQNLLGVSKFVS